MDPNMVVTIAMAVSPQALRLSGLVFDGFLDFGADFVDVSTDSSLFEAKEAKATKRCVTRRSYSVLVRRLPRGYLRRMVYECLPEEYSPETVQLFDRHLSFIFSELMAEADGCFCRMENRDSNTLVNLGA